MYIINTPPAHMFTVYLFNYLVKTFKLYSLSKFQLYSVINNIDAMF